MFIVPLVLFGLVNGSDPEIQGLESLATESKGGFTISEVVSLPSTSDSVYILSSGSKVESELCDINTLSHLYLYKEKGRLTAGFASVGGEGSIEYIELASESQFLYLPESSYSKVIEIVKSLTPINWHEKMIVVPMSIVNQLPVLYFQFSLSSIQFEVHPRAYTRCETSGLSSARKCVVLIKKNEAESWVIGKPLLDHVVYSMSIGSDSNPMARMCLPPNPLTNYVTAQAVATHRRLPFNRQQYMLGIALSIFLIFILWWFWGDVICKCCKRRPAASAAAPVLVVRSRRASNKSTPQESGNDDKQPLINKV